MKRLIMLSTLTVLASCSSTKSPDQEQVTSCPLTDTPPTKVWETAGFNGPESVVYDLKTKSYYVSNVTGGPLDKDGTGFISKLNSNGKITKLKWVKGKSVNAPKGMRIRSGYLWYTDIDTVNSVIISKARLSSGVKIPGAKFLNDIVFSKSGSAIYVTDMFTNKIHSVQKSPNYSTYLESMELEYPNGIVSSDNELVVASWGPGLDKSNFKTQKQGKLLSINEKTKKISNWSDVRIGNLDGVEFIDKNTIIVSDWMNGKVFKVTKSGGCKTLLTGFKGSADLTYIPSKNLVVIPLMLENKVVAFKLK